jgi:hypothetical protein
MKKLRSGLICSISTFVLIACVSTTIIGSKEDSYPAAWPKIVLNPDEDCPLLNGRFRNVGEAARRDLHFIPTLSETVFRRPNTLSSDATASFEFSSPADMDPTLQVTFDGSTGDLDSATSISVTDDLACEDGFLKLSRHREGYVDGTSSELEEVILFGTSDGYLVVHHHFVSSSSALLIFRDKSEGHLWYRFEALN